MTQGMLAFVRSNGPEVSDDEDVGLHYVHTGAMYDSSLVLPTTGSRA